MMFCSCSGIIPFVKNMTENVCESPSYAGDDNITSTLVFISLINCVNLPVIWRWKSGVSVVHHLCQHRAVDARVLRRKPRTYASMSVLLLRWFTWLFCRPRVTSLRRLAHHFNTVVAVFCLASEMWNMVRWHIDGGGVARICSCWEVTLAWAPAGQEGHLPSPGKCTG